MRYKELKEKVEEWGQKYGIATEIRMDENLIEICSKTVGDELVFTKPLAYINKNKRLTFSLTWGIFRDVDLTEFAKNALFEIILTFAQTDPKDREDEKRFIIPLPGLITTDGKQQYLTKNVSYFASRRDKGLRQTWKEEHLMFVPAIYRQFAVEFDEDREY